MHSQPLLMASAVLYVIAIYQAQAAEFRWSTNTVDYPSEGRCLVGHVIATYDNAACVTQCARRCQLTADCASYNFRSDVRRCEINSASHVGHSEDVIVTDGCQYFKRDAYTTDQTALGPCASFPCQNGGTCLTSRTNDGVLSALCLCADGWTGSDCSQTADSLPMWGDWTDWETCSSSCGDGVKSRRRSCVDQTTGQTVSSQLCYGRDQEQMYCKGVLCPAWSDYSDWGQCSTDTRCGRGVKVRTRSCTNGGTPGVDRLCKGPTNQTAVCQSPKCDAAVRLVGGSTYGEGRVNIYNDITDQWLPVCASGWTKTNADVVCRQMGFPAAADDYSGDYGAEAGASVAMGGVSCQGNEASLATCSHTSWQDTACSSGPHAGVKCKVDGRWGAWQDWGQCSATCGQGVNTRTRQCDWPPALRGGTPCSGDATETKPCTMSPCPVDATWSDWTDWTTCSVTCGGGSQSRSRTCTPGRHGGRDCVGDSTQTQDCNEQHCPVDGKFSDWSDWDACSVTCGSGTHSRRRQCIPPQYGGQPCVGDTVETEDCFDRFCPVDGSWGPWSDWGVCNATCGGGHQSRTRHCTQPQHGGLACPGPAVDYQSCNQQSCAIDGVWEDWSEWSSCNATCGGGIKVRTRTCHGPFHGGQPCIGNDRDEQFCSDNPCKVDGQWSDWTRWLECSVSCGHGEQMRYRVCFGAANGGRTCPGNAEEYRQCDAGPCPVNCTWNAWKEWSACNATCGTAVRTRTRDKVPAQHGGEDCEGNAIETEVCSTNPCPIPGDWLDWSDWSQCSATCGNDGIRTRTRTCDMTSHGSLTIDCLPENGLTDTDTQPCHRFTCTPTARSCAELYKRGLEDNTYVTIDSDGSGPELPYTAYCQRNATQACTVIHTVEESEISVQGYEGACEYDVGVRYVDNAGNAVDISQLIPLVDLSTTCRQLVKWRCLSATINSPNSDFGGAQKLTYWTNRHGDGTGYFGGRHLSAGSTSTVMCACGETDSCGEPGLRCNCDKNDQQWRSDEGFITHRPDLPVKSFCAGDTGTTGEEGYYTVGPLICC